MRKSLILLLFISLSSLSQAKQNEHPIFYECADILMKPKGIKTFLIEPIPVQADLQLADKIYIFDYEVKSVMNRKKGETKHLRNNLLDSTQYIRDARRMCPFVAKYAVEFTKGDRNLTIIFSNAPCSKIIIYCPNSTIHTMQIDISESNEILSCLEGLVPDEM